MTCLPIVDDVEVFAADADFVAEPITKEVEVSRMFTCEVCFHHVEFEVAA